MGLLPSFYKNKDKLAVAAKLLTNKKTTIQKTEKKKRQKDRQTVKQTERL